MSADLIPAGEQSPYAALQLTPTDLQDLITSNLAPGESIGVRDLPRVKIPGGGATTWEVPTINGEQATKELRGVLVQVATRRTFWRTEYTGANDPPDCFSPDGLHGIGEPGIECAACPFNQFPEENGGPKPCKEIRQLFLLPEGGILPLVVNVTPGSLINARQFFFGLMNARLKRTHVEVVLRLTKAQNKGGLDYSQVTFTLSERQLAPEAREQIDAYAKLLGPFLAEVGVDREAVEEPEAAAFADRPQAA